jgi:hypothetical protein
MLLPLRRALGDPKRIEPVCQVGYRPDLALPAIGGCPKMEPVLVRIMAVPHQRAREVVHLV